MRKLICAAAVALTAGALPVSLSATPALAATTWTVSPGGSFSGAATLALYDSTTHTWLPGGCASSQLAGSLKSGTGLTGTGLGTVTITAPSCSVPAGAVWSLNARFYQPSTGVTSATITKIHLTVDEGGGCGFVLDGTSDTASNGKINVKYHNTQHALVLDPVNGSTLHIYDLTCSNGFDHNGDAVTMTATYRITPAQTITSP